MVTTALPQLKVMTPPRVAAAWSLANVQLVSLPVPTTVVGLEMSAGWPLAGTPAPQDPLGFPALVIVPVLVARVPPGPPVPPVAPVFPPV
jgi:hypothetical protein